MGAKRRLSCVRGLMVERGVTRLFSVDPASKLGKGAKGCTKRTGGWIRIFMLAYEGVGTTSYELSLRVHTGTESCHGCMMQPACALINT